MIDENEPTEEEVAEKKWIAGPTAFLRYGKSAPELRKLVKEKKLKTRKMNGRDEYFTDDLENLEDGAIDPAVAMADLVRASRDLVDTVLKQDSIKFDKYQAAFDKLLDASATQADKQNEHILALEKQAMEMREAAEKVFNLEHERKMSELREERTRSMQAKALEMLQKTAMPWIAAKMGGTIPGAGAASTQAPGETDPRLAHLGTAVVNMVCNMTDEQFHKLGAVIPPDEFGVLTMIRESFKATNQGEVS